MLKSMHRQQGMSIWGLMTLMVVLAFFILLTLKLLPVYYQQFKLVKALHNTRNELEGDSGPSAIRRKLREKFSIDDITIIKAEDIVIESSGNGKVVRAEVEVREHVVGNISLLISINESVEIP